MYPVLSDPEITDLDAAGRPPNTIILAGATGALGRLIAHHLRNEGAQVIALIRKGRSGPEAASLKKEGVILREVDYEREESLEAACSGGSCVVSALSGLREVIIDAQARLLQAAIRADVPRFIPSDYCIDFCRLKPGSNRNLDLRREFAAILDAAPVSATSIFNGMFTDLLTGQAPVILFGLKRVVYWETAEQPLDFTTMNDTAAFTAKAAMDTETPRFLRIAGEVASARDIVRAAEGATGNKFRLLRPGGLSRLAMLIRITRALFPQKSAVFPAWQGMQYLHNMFSGRPKLAHLDNDRYPGMRWTGIRDVLSRREA